MSQRVVLAGAVLAMIVSGVALYRSFKNTKPVDGQSENLFQAYTEVTAQEISKLLGGRGDVVVLMWGPPSDDANHQGGPPAVQAMCQALQKAGLRVVAKNSVPPVRVRSGTVWTAENYRSVAEKYPQVGAIVSFVGAPELSAEVIHQLPSPRPKLIVVRFAELETARPLLQQGVLDGAVLPQTEAPANNHPPKTTREWFDKYYLFATPANASQLSGT